MKTISGASSARMVLSNDDLLFEILLLLPVISIIRFQLVSKRWQFLIKSRDFTLRWNENPKIDQPSGLFIEQKGYLAENNFFRLPGDNTSSFPLRITFPFSSADIEIKHSCNGLLLCFLRPDKVFVYNPTTKQFKFISEDQQPFILDEVNRSFTVKLAFDPIKSPHYKVIYTRFMHNNYSHDLSIEIWSFSSETNSWRVFPDRFPFDLFTGFSNGVFWDDAIHWLGFEGLHSKLNLNDMVLSTIPNPGFSDGNICFNHDLMDSGGGLFLSCIVDTPLTDYSGLLNVYEMKKRCSEWSLKYLIDVDYVKTLLPKPRKISDSRFILRYVAVGEREEDTFIVAEICGQVVQYNFGLKTLSKICAKTVHIECFPFIPSLAGV